MHDYDKSNSMCNICNIEKSKNKVLIAENLELKSRVEEIQLKIAKQLNDYPKIY